MKFHPRCTLGAAITLLSTMVMSCQGAGNVAPFPIVNVVQHPTDSIPAESESMRSLVYFKVEDAIPEDSPVEYGPKRTPEQQRAEHRERVIRGLFRTREVRELPEVLHLNRFFEEARKLGVSPEDISAFVRKHFSRDLQEKVQAAVIGPEKELVLLSDVVDTRGQIRDYGILIELGSDAGVDELFPVHDPLIRSLKTELEANRDTWGSGAVWRICLKGKLSDRYQPIALRKTVLANGHRTFDVEVEHGTCVSNRTRFLGEGILYSNSKSLRVNTGYKGSASLPGLFLIPESGGNGAVGMPSAYFEPIRWQMDSVSYYLVPGENYVYVSLPENSPDARERAKIQLLRELDGITAAPTASCGKAWLSGKQTCATPDSGSRILEEGNCDSCVDQSYPLDFFSLFLNDPSVLIESRGKELSERVGAIEHKVSAVGGMSLEQVPSGMVEESNDVDKLAADMHWSRYREFVGSSPGMDSSWGGAVDEKPLLRLRVLRISDEMDQLVEEMETAGERDAKPLSLDCCQLRSQPLPPEIELSIRIARLGQELRLASRTLISAVRAQEEALDQVILETEWTEREIQEGEESRERQIRRRYHFVRAAAIYHRWVELRFQNLIWKYRAFVSARFPEVTLCLGAVLPRDRDEAIDLFLASYPIWTGDRAQRGNITPLVDFDPNRPDRMAITVSEVPGWKVNVRFRCFCGASTSVEKPGEESGLCGILQREPEARGSACYPLSSFKWAKEKYPRGLDPAWLGENRGTRPVPRESSASEGRTPAKAGFSWLNPKSRRELWEIFSFLVKNAGA